MQTLNSINEQLAFYRNSEYKWVRELTTSFEQYFDTNFREFLTYAEFSEIEMRQILLFSLFTLHSILSNNDDYWYDETTQALNELLFKTTNLSTQKNSMYKSDRVEDLFSFVTLPFRTFQNNISRQILNYYKLKVDDKTFDKVNEQIEIHKSKSEYEIKAADNFIKEGHERIRKVKYTKVALTEAADIEIVANLRALPKVSTLNQLERESQRILGKGKISKSVWHRHHRNVMFWKLVINEIESRINSNRKMKQDTIDKLMEWKSILQSEIHNLDARQEWEKRIETGDIYDKKMPVEYQDDKFNYIKISYSKSPDLGDNFDDNEAKELDDYGEGHDLR